MSAIRKLLWPAVATLIALAILLNLGFWQLGRLFEKERQLAALERAITSGPVRPLADDLVQARVRDAGFPTTGATELAELTRVEVEGVFLPARSVPVRATLPNTRGAPISGIGFFWMTPLRLANGTHVFINRGFVPSGADFKPPAISTPEGPQVITGLVRAPEIARAFTPADNPAKGEYFSRNPKVMATAVGLPPENVANLFIDVERAPGSGTPPVGIDAREMIVRIPNNHLQYAVTWFAFAATLIGVFAFFARARLKESA